MNDTKPKHRWFRFSIRDLLWLTVVVAMAVAWGIRLAKNARLEADLESMKDQATISVHDAYKTMQVQPVRPIHQ